MPGDLNPIFGETDGELVSPHLRALVELTFAVDRLTKSVDHLAGLLPEAGDIPYSIREAVIDAMPYPSLILGAIADGTREALETKP